MLFPYLLIKSMPAPTLAQETAWIYEEEMVMRPINTTELEMEFSVFDRKDLVFTRVILHVCMCLLVSCMDKVEESKLPSLTF